MTPDELRERTKRFAIEVIVFVRSLQSDDVTRVLGKQLLRSGTSVGANYRAACLAKSTADMIAKLKIVEEEVDETDYWLELIEVAGFKSERLVHLQDESLQLKKIMVASIRTLKGRG